MAAPPAVLCWWRRDDFTIIGVGSAGMCPQISCEREYRRACERRELQDRLSALWIPPWRAMIKPSVCCWLSLPSR